MEQENGGREVEGGYGLNPTMTKWWLDGVSISRDGEKKMNSNPDQS